MSEQLRGSRRLAEQFLTVSAGRVSLGQTIELAVTANAAAEEQALPPYLSMVEQDELTNGYGFGSAVPSIAKAA